jgi:FkbM family methyltransferase
MKFLSYAQNFEDVILNRAFKGQDQGFYIDIGAAHPVGHSVTKNFYERGWNGINIEPGTAAFALVVADRTRDINLNVGISRTPGQLTFYEAPDSIGLSTFNDDWREKWHQTDGHNFVEKTVPVMTLTDLCEQYVHQPIDFLKIDVEGHEPEVLAGADFFRWRPKVVVVEGDRELYQEKLLESNYLHATFDGVNHYFVSAEESRLIPLLNAPVSLVADNFELHETISERFGHHHAIKLLTEERQKCQQLESELRGSQQKAEELAREVNGYRKEIEAWLSESAQRRGDLEHNLVILKQEAIEASAIRDELEATLQETLQQLAELTANHQGLRARVAPLIDFKRAIKRVDGVFGHPAHRLRMMSSNLRQGTRSAGARRD